MNIKKIIMGLVASTIISTASYAVELRDSFRGANGGIRVIDSINTIGDTTTFTITTTNRRGITKTKEFTATKNGDIFTVSGNGKSAFKNWLKEHAAIQYNTTNIEGRDNKIAFKAWKDFIVERARSNNNIFADSLSTLEYDPSNDYIGRAENEGLEVNYNDPNQIGEAAESHVAEGTRVPVLYNRYGDMIYEGRAETIYNQYQIPGLEEAHLAGWTGQGVNIGIKEDVVNQAGRHYTMVSGIAQSIAPDATVTGIHWDDAYVNRHIDFDKLDIVNHSYGYTNHYNLADTNGFSNVIARNYNQAPNALHIYAAGNNAGVCPLGPETTKCSGFKDVIDNGNEHLLNDLIVVTSTAIGSQHAGDVAEHTITTTPYDFESANGGTSAAAPKVAGVAALVMHKFPNLDIQGVKEKILSGAEDIGAPGTDRRYGRGYLSVTGALSPTGTLN